MVVNTKAADPLPSLPMWTTFVLNLTPFSLAGSYGFYTRSHGVFGFAMTGGFSSRNWTF